MYLGVDIGGTKTLIATIDDKGKIIDSIKFATPQKYLDFLQKFQDIIARFTTKSFKLAVLGLPATELDRKNGVGVSFGNLPWKNIRIKKDIEAIVRLPVALENDAKLAGLAEAVAIKNRFSKVLYITISTGIGTALIVDQSIDTSFGDGGGATITLEYEGKMVPWESFASGKAIVQRFGKRAEEINDPKIWETIAHDVAVGLIDVIAMTEPEVVIIGGAVGNYLYKFIEPLKKYLKKFDNPLLPLPQILEATHPDEAVIYGCYELARRHHG